MKKSASTEQTVSLNRTDFEKTTKLRKPSCSFAVDIVRGRLNAINPPVPAKDLLAILQEDEIIRDLLRKHQYSFSLSSDFQLSIKDITEPAQPVGEEK